METSTRYDHTSATARVTLRDGTELSYIDRGSGDVVVMIPGWSQSAAQFKHQIGALSADHRVIAVDMRGHGESSKPKHGYRVSRLATDVHEFLAALDLRDVTILGHSMGCSIIWAYIDQFDTERLSRLVLVDEAPMCTGMPGWSDQDRLTYGCMFPNATELESFVSAIAGTLTAKGVKNLIRGMFTASISEAELDWVAERNVMLPREAAAELFYNHCLTDWRDVVQSITLPTLVVGAEASVFSAPSQRWIAAQNPNATVEIFEASQGGSHFMFIENPERFNRAVGAFLASKSKVAGAM